MRRRSRVIYLLLLVGLVLCAGFLGSCFVERQLQEPVTEDKSDDTNEQSDGDYADVTQEDIGVDVDKDGYLEEDFSVPRLSEQDFSELYPEGYMEDTEKTLEGKMEDVVSETKVNGSKQVTDTQREIIAESSAWLASWRGYDENTTYKLVDENTVRIGNWVFMNSGEDIDIYTMNPITDAEYTLLEARYPWGKLVFNQDAKMWEWLKPSYVCSSVTVGWHLEDGIAPGCPLP